MDASTIHRRRWATLGVLCLSLMIIGLDNTILNVALPTLSRDLNATDSQLQWIVDSYTLVFAGLLLTAGSLGDRFGRRRALFLGLAVFAGASVAAAWVDSPGALITARAAMGVGGAVIMPATLSILTNVFTDARERAKAIGIWAAVSGLGIVLGPTAGGWLLEHFWWGSVFLVNVPVAVVTLLIGFWLVPDSRDPAAPRIDVVGSLLSIVGLSTVVWGIIEGHSRGWTSAPILASFALAGVALAGFVYWQHRSDHPMLDLRFFRDRRFSAACVAITLVFFALFGTIFFLTQHLQFVLGYSPLAAGQRLLPIATMVIGAPIAMRVMLRVGARVVVPLGLTIVTGGLLLLSTTTIDDGYGHVGIVLSLIGFGMGATMAPATEAVMASLPAAKAGVGSAMNDAVRQVGGTLGVAVLGSILSSSYAAQLGAGQVPARATDGLGAALAVADTLPPAAARDLVEAARLAFVEAMGTTVLVAAAVAGAGAVVAFLWLPGHRPAPDGLDAELRELADAEALAPAG
ncbi:MAG TPA: DHA2 family efflux MFS transporter permease subunit [Pilimelia sp.]|nr:DHA2 family efflux MFS transporter permease subunit [Pilimelia sp.]